MGAMKQKHILSRRTLVLAGGVAALSAFIGLNIPNRASAASEIFKTTFGSVAIEGTDPVAYFKEGRVREGSKQFSHKWKGANWRFSNAANRDAFAASPEEYAPQFGGYCAWAVSQGYTAKIDPEAWKIVGGKLYLNYSKGVQAKWAQDIPGNIAKGEKNWPAVLD